MAFCAHALLPNPPEVLEVHDALEDERFFDNPLVTGVPSTLCVIDREPRRLSEGQRAALRALARQVTSQLELQMAQRKLAERNRDLERLHAENNQLIGMAAHDLRNPLQVIDGYTAS